MTAYPNNNEESIGPNHPLKPGESLVRLSKTEISTDGENWKDINSPIAGAWCKVSDKKRKNDSSTS